MTTRERLKGMLTERGMFDENADEVLKEAIPRIEKSTPDYKITWDRPADEYLDAFYDSMWLSLRDVALEWIDEKAPEAWFRPMFE